MVGWNRVGSSPWSLPVSGHLGLVLSSSYILLMSTLLVVLVYGTEAKAQPVTRVFQVTPGRGEVEVINQIGTIRVVSTDARPDRVSLLARRLGGDATISTQQTGSGKVVIEIGGRGTVEIELIVPTSIALDLLTYKGDIAVSDHQGKVRARIVSDGDIFFTGLKSSVVEGRCHYGNVHFSGTPVTQGDYLLKSFSGQLDIRFPTGADFKLLASTHQGGLDLADFPLRYDRQLRDVVEAVSGAGRSKVYLQTQEGKIRLQRLL